MTELEKLQQKIIGCTRCPRLTEYRREVARKKRRMYADWEYWGKPLPAFGDPDARVLLLGLAPAAHGGNRTGRMFTGDRSGDWVFGALHRFGFASQPESTHRDDGQSLKGAYITAALRCAPPKNKPLREELANCQTLPAEGVRSARQRAGCGGAGAYSLRRLSAAAAGTGADAAFAPAEVRPRGGPRDARRAASGVLLSSQPAEYADRSTHQEDVR